LTDDACFRGHLWVLDHRGDGIVEAAEAAEDGWNWMSDFLNGGYAGRRLEVVGVQAVGISKAARFDKAVAAVDDGLASGGVVEGESPLAVVGLAGVGQAEGGIVLDSR
jgi:hypothetical protein